MAEYLCDTSTEGHGGNGQARDGGPDGSSGRVESGTGGSGGVTEITDETGNIGADGLDPNSRSAVGAPYVPSRSSCPPEVDDDQPVLDPVDWEQKWRDAIKKKDCRSLLDIFNAQEEDASRRSLCRDVTGEGGRTALHVAAMEGSFPLAKLLIDLVWVEHPYSELQEFQVGTADGTEKLRFYPSNVAFEFMEAQDERSGLTAFGMAINITLNPSTFQYFKYKIMDPEERNQDGGMYDAYEGTEWHTALAQGDCAVLRMGLKGNSRLLLETCAGLSVLDVAIMKNDKELVELVVRAFGRARDKISWPAESYFPYELTWEWIAKGHFGGCNCIERERYGFHRGATREKLGTLGLTGVKSRATLNVVESALELADMMGGSQEIRNFLGEVGNHIDPEKFMWRDAIERKDCRSLLNILDAKEDDASRVSLCCEVRGEGDRTALHVAAMQGCFRLANLVVDLVWGKDDPDSSSRGFFSTATGDKGHSWSPSQDAFDFYVTVDARSGLTAFEMANDIIGNTSISQYFLYKRMLPERRDEYKGMYDAYEGTEWHTALTQGDCAILLRLLRYNSRLLLETWGGLSVLDVAIMKKDKELVEMVARAFGRAVDKITWPAESYFPCELTWEWISKGHFGWVGNDRSRRYGFHRGATREKLAKLGLGSAKKNFAKSLSSVKSALDLADRMGSSEEMKGLLEKAEGVSNTDDSETQLSEYEILEHSLADVIDEDWQSEWDEGYEEDVDYNFEDKSSPRFRILRFHYACKHLNSHEDYFRSMLFELSGRDVGILLDCLGKTWDGQGRTPVHVLVDHYKGEDSFPKFFQYAGVQQKGSLESFVIALDSRGRLPMVRAYIKQLFEKTSKVFNDTFKNYESITEERLPKLGVEKGFYSKDNWNLNLWLFYMILFLQDESALQLLFKVYKAPNLMNVLEGAKFQSILFTRFETNTLCMVAATGLQSILQLCLKNFDPSMIEDGEGKTALHYAADASSAKFCQPPLCFYCSVDYKCTYKVKDMWPMQYKDKEKAQSNVNCNVEQDLKLVMKGLDVNVGRKACILMLLQAGVDISQEDKEGNIPDPRSSSEASFQSWWYDTLVKDTLEKKNNFNQAGNALSVVGTLVAATSYIGPLQPPLNYDNATGYIESSRLLVKVFMVSNTLAFYLAVASVMFAVVPSLPMPQEGVIDELRRAQKTVASSLGLLLGAIGCILVSFAAATAVVVDNDHYYSSRDFLLSPSIIGWLFCLVAMVVFTIRVLRLVFYRNLVIRILYKFSFIDFLKKAPVDIFKYTIIFSFNTFFLVPTFLLIVPVRICSGESLKHVRKDCIYFWRHRCQKITINPFCRARN